MIAHAGNKPFDNHGIVNPPVYHASTVLHESVTDFFAQSEKRSEPGVTFYGHLGTPTHHALEQALTELEGGYHCVLTSSGLSAITTALLAVAQTGDHILVTDSVYWPNRKFCDSVLTKFGVETEYYDPLIAGGIESLIRTNTRAIFLESPGSMTFEMQDVPAIVKVAQKHAVVTLLDNTWGTPLYFKPLQLGVDISIHAGTKYIVGHSDAMLGVIITNEKLYLPVRQMFEKLGQCVGPDDVYLSLRGLRSMSARLDRHQATTLKICEWLRTRKEVSRIIYPALPDDPGYEIWKRDFTGACGLFAMVLGGYNDNAVEAMLDGMRLFRIGASWGGYESLSLPMFPDRIRTATTWKAEGPLVRLHVGLEDVDDLIADLEDGFERLNKAQD